jgi:hypothetical protein
MIGVGSFSDSSQPVQNRRTYRCGELGVRAAADLSLCKADAQRIG